MNGVHDMGGMQCFGPVIQESGEPLFHEAWERQVFALTLAMGTGGCWNIDTARFERERLPPDLYLGSDYYQIWLEALERLLVRSGLILDTELADGRAQASSGTLPAQFRKLDAEHVSALFMRGWPSEREPAAPARFTVGDRVRTVNGHPTGHTRLPRYARDRDGIILAIRGAHVFPDSNARFAGESPHWLYSVRFEAADLWGADTTASAVYVDCWEPYLLPDSTGLKDG